MDIKLARTNLAEKPLKVTTKKLEELLESGTEIFYCDKENSHKDMQSLLEYFEKKGRRAFFREVRYGLDEGDFMYEIHLI